MRLQADDIFKAQFLNELVSSLETDLGAGAIVEVIAVTPEGEIITTVTFWGSEGVDAAIEAEDKVTQGLDGLAALSANAWISRLGDLVIDSEGTNADVIRPDDSVKLEFDATFTNLDVLVRAVLVPLGFHLYHLPRADPLSLPQSAPSPLPFHFLPAFLAPSSGSLLNCPLLPLLDVDELPSSPIVAEL